MPAFATRWPARTARRHPHPLLEPAALRAALEPARAVLLLGAGESRMSAQALEAAIASDPQQPPASHRTRVFAIAAGALAAHGRMVEAQALFNRALAEAAYGPDAGDPAARVLAITGNNLACELETRGASDPPTRQLLLEAATAARRWWAVAGGELEIGRAEYRLAKTCLVLDQAETALVHARLALTHAQDPQVPPVDRAFAHLAIGECLDRLHRPAEAVQARAAAAALVPTLIPEMRTVIERELAQAGALRTGSGSG